MNIDWEEFTNKTATTAEVRLLGRVEVSAVIALQKLMVHEVRQQSRINAAVLICEHPPSITQGTDGNLLELPTDPRELESKLIVVHKVKRDGHVVLHQPGQLCVYVVVNLAECEIDKTEFRRRLVQAIMQTCEEQQVKARCSRTDETVIEGRHGLIAELGIGVENDVTSFGLYLNVACRLDEQRRIGRGLLGERISSMNAERVRPTQMSQVRSSLIQHICSQLGYPEYHIHSGHPFLKRTRVQVHDRFTDH